ncbi:MAG: OmpA family protein [Bacteroidales bacterium]|nr:OmpA family protein [Bacteroidales bacterium]
MHRFTLLAVLFAAIYLLPGMQDQAAARGRSVRQDTIQKMPLEVLVTNTQNDPRQGEEVVFVDTLSQVEYRGITGSNGKFRIQLPEGSTYLVKIKGISDQQDYQVFSIPELADNRQYRTSQFLIKYDPPTVYTLDNVYFGSNKATLREASYKELNELVEYMERRKHIRVEIAGHTDNVGSKEANLKLSRRRARRVKAYLVSQGIAEGRIEARGYGEDHPVAGNNTEAGRQKNRRTEVRILEDSR